MKEEIAQKKDHIAHLEGTLQQLDEDADRLRDLIKEKDLQIQDLEDQLAKMNEKPPTPEPEPEEPEPAGNYVADYKDEVDVMLAKFINMNNCPVPIKRLGGGYYLFGTKKIYAKILNGRLVIRVGGGYMVIDEFIQTYAQQELVKIQARRAAGEDPFALDEHGSPVRGYTTGSPRSSNKGSPKRGGGINGSQRTPKTLKTTDIERLKASGAAREI